MTSRSNHEHALKLVVATAADAKFQCNGCKEDGAGDRYRCDFDKPCNFNLHKYCFHAEDTLVHPLFHDYKFELRREAPDKNNERQCDACGTHVDGWYYHYDRKGLDLHPCCAKLPMEIKHEELTFKLRKEDTHRCNICRKRKFSETFWYYRSTCTPTVYLHVRCVKEKLQPSGSGGSTSNTHAANTTTMTPFVQAALQGYTYERTCEIVAVVFRVILAFISGDRTEIINEVAHVISTTCSTGR